MEVEVEQYVAVVEAGADLQYTIPDGLQTMADGRVEVMIMLSQLFDVAVVEAGAELGKKCAGRGAGKGSGWIHLRKSPTSNVGEGLWNRVIVNLT